MKRFTKAQEKVLRLLKTGNPLLIMEGSKEEYLAWGGRAWMEKPPNWNTINSLLLLGLIERKVLTSCECFELSEKGFEEFSRAL